MNLKNQALLLISAAVFAAGCGNADYKKTKEGLAYKIISDGKGAKIENGQMLKIHFSNVVGDSTIFSTFEHIPAYGKYDSSINGTYDFIDFLGEMKVGDSAVYTRSVDSLEKRGVLKYGGAFKKGAEVKGYVKILGTFPNEEAMNADHMKEVEVEKDREVAKLEAYLKEKNIPVQKTKNGVFVEVTNPGTGVQVDSGMRVVINYTGTLMNGKKFDSNVDSSFQHVSPLDFVVGSGQVIPGWEEGLQVFKEGGEGRLFIPAMLAYGPQARGEEMPAFSDLIFEIKVLGVGKPAPPVPGMQEPAMPH